MSDIYFTADTHFGHKNIIDYCNRPFSNIKEMDDCLITNWNKKIKTNDIVYHLGDFSYTPEKYFNSLNGQIYLIIGNHDDMRICKKLNFVCIREYKKIKINHLKIILFHYPIAEWDSKFHGSWHLHGHTHDTYKNIGSILDVGVDSMNYEPISFDEMCVIMNKKNEDDKSYFNDKIIHNE